MIDERIYDTSDVIEYKTCMHLISVWFHNTFCWLLESRYVGIRGSARKGGIGGKFGKKQNKYRDRKRGTKTKERSSVVGMRKMVCAIKKRRQRWRHDARVTINKRLRG